VTDSPVPSSPLAIPEFRFYWLSRFAAVLSTMSMVVILGYQVYDTARGPAYGMSVRDASFYLGMVGLAQFIPLFLLTPVAGWTADRFERRTVVRLANCIDLLVALTLAYVTWRGIATLPVLFGMAALHGTARVFIGPASSAIAPNIVPPALLPQAIAMSSIAWQSASVLGPAIAGFLYGAHPSAPYWFASGGLVVATLALFPIRRIMPPVMDRTKHPLRQMIEGLSYVRTHRFLMGAITLDLFAVILGGATALLPVYARDILHVGPEGLGYLRAAPGVGAAVVALWFAFRPLRYNVGVKMLLAVAGFGAATVVFGFSKYMPLSLIALVALGGFDMLSVYVRSSLVQLHTPDAMRGRVSAVSGLAISASNELGAVQSGVASALLGPVGAVVVGGVAAIAVPGIWAYIYPELRRARTFDPPETALAEAVMQEKPA
jgi:MFS family permease